MKGAIQKTIRSLNEIIATNQEDFRILKKKTSQWDLDHRDRKRAEGEFVFPI